MLIPFEEILKIPLMNDRATKFLGINPKNSIPKPLPKVVGYPPVMIQRVTNNDDGYPPFYVSLEVKQLILHNCMLDSRDEVNIMSFKVINQLESTMTRPFGNVCGMDPRPI